MNYHFVISYQLNIVLLMNDRLYCVESCGTFALHLCHGELERNAKLFTRY